MANFSETLARPVSVSKLVSAHYQPSSKPLYYLWTQICLSVTRRFEYLLIFVAFLDVFSV